MKERAEFAWEFFVPAWIHFPRAIVVNGSDETKHRRFVRKPHTRQNAQR